MEKPKMKREFVVTSSYKESGDIYFQTGNKSLIGEIREFGIVKDSEFGLGYFLRVDPRYDFDEVLAYAKNLELGDAPEPECEGDPIVSIWGIYPAIGVIMFDTRDGFVLKKLIDWGQVRSYATHGHMFAAYSDSYYEKAVTYIKAIHFGFIELDD